MHTDPFLQDEGREKGDEHGPGKTDRIEFGERQANRVRHGIEAEGKAKRPEQAAQQDKTRLVNFHHTPALLQDNRNDDDQRNARAPEGKEAWIEGCRLDLGKREEHGEGGPGGQHPERAFNIARCGPHL